MKRVGIYRSDAWADFVVAYQVEHERLRVQPPAGALARNPDAPRVELDVDGQVDDGPRGVACCGGVALRCHAAAGTIDDS